MIGAMQSSFLANVKLWRLSSLKKNSHSIPAKYLKNDICTEADNQIESKRRECLL